MRKAFTLAEVLITLAIIGIVAALTIPSVISNYQQQEFKTGLKKAVSVLNEAIQMNISQDGETPYKRQGTDLNSASNTADSSRLQNYLTRHMSIIKKENGKFTAGGGGTVNGWYQGATKNHAFYTTDGMRFEVPIVMRVIGVDHFNSDGTVSNIKLHESGLDLSSTNIRDNSLNSCGSYGLGSNPNNTEDRPCYIVVDVNGDKKPTVYSANVTIASGSGSVKQNYSYPSPTDKKITDIFTIMITDEKAIPFGVVAQRAMYSK